MAKKEDYSNLPKNLPAPIDDGKASHLAGKSLSDLSLKASDGSLYNISNSNDRLKIIFFYPMTGHPNIPLPKDWNNIPGARGCTLQNIGFRDNYDFFTGRKATVLGVSTQTSEKQQEFSSRMDIPYLLLSDSDHSLMKNLEFPSLEVEGVLMYKRLTIIVLDNKIEKVFYPIFPPDKHSEEVIQWLEKNITHEKF